MTPNVQKRLHYSADAGGSSVVAPDKSAGVRQRPRLQGQGRPTTCTGSVALGSLRRTLLYPPWPIKWRGGMHGVSSSRPPRINPFSRERRLWTLLSKTPLLFGQKCCSKCVDFCALGGGVRPWRGPLTGRIRRDSFAVAKVEAP